MVRAPTVSAMKNCCPRDRFIDLGVDHRRNWAACGTGDGLEFSSTEQRARAHPTEGCVGAAP